MSGGRESGEARVRSADAEIKQPTGVSAAAYPAARREASLNQMADDWAKLAHERLERIRELEAELAERCPFPRAHQSMFDKIAALEAELAKRPRDPCEEYNRAESLQRSNDALWAKVLELKAHERELEIQLRKAGGRVKEFEAAAEPMGSC